VRVLREYLKNGRCAAGAVNQKTFGAALAHERDKGQENDGDDECDRSRQLEILNYVEKPGQSLSRPFLLFGRNTHAAARRCMLRQEPEADFVIADGNARQERQHHDEYGQNPPQCARPRLPEFTGRRKRESAGADGKPKQIQRNVETEGECVHPGRSLLSLIHTRRGLATIVSMSKMLDEIREQPAVLDRTLRSQLPAAERLRKAFEQRRPRLIMLAARGTSDNAAQFGRYLLEITTGIPVSLAAPSVFTIYKAALDFRDTLVIALSQSGESTDTNMVLEQARAAGALTVGITNERDSSTAKLAEHVFHVRAGKEKSIAATKTYTGQLMSIYLIAYALGAKIGLDDLRRVPDWTNAALSLEPEIAERAGRYRFMDHAVVVGRGLNYSNAFEFALKMMETCYVIAERFSSADLMHGPIAIVERSFPVFVFAPTGVTWPGLSELITKLHQLKAETTLITDASNREAVELNPRAMVVPAKLGRKTNAVEELYTPIPYIVPAQLFAACLAAEKGLNPDQPRTLSKVTQTL
jgi:glutamine---fructose-6-phosphate transaminase (isomerizing)